MTRRLLEPARAAALAAAFALAAPAAYAAPPTAAQVERLLDAMDVESTLEAMAGQMEASMRSMEDTILGADPTPEQRARFDRTMAEQSATMREFMAPERLRPIWRDVYTEEFTAEEVQALADFYSSPTGRSILRKMPVATGRAMRAMQPMIEETVQQAQQTLVREFGTAPSR